MASRLCALTSTSFYCCLQVMLALVLVVSSSQPQEYGAPTRQEQREGSNGLALSLIQSGAHLYQRWVPDKSILFAHHLPLKPNPELPLMFVTEGCDGSTAILEHAYSILLLHGINAGDVKVQKELLDPSRNWNYHGDIVEAMKEVHQSHRDNNETLVFKSIFKRDREATLSEGLRQMGTLAVFNSRDNLLDKLVCMIRDCFLDTDWKTTPYGFPVDEHGKPSDLCFDRRDSKKKDLAFIKVSEPVPGENRNRSLLAESLEFFENQEKQGFEELVKAGYQPEKVTYEKLVAFEAGGDENVQVSVKEWRSLLQSWGVTADEKKLQDYFSAQDHWSEEGQKATIYNLREVERELKNLGKLDLLHK